MIVLPTIASFWHGPLSWLERVSIASFVRHGHKVDIYSYEPEGDLPPGAEWKNAEEVVPREKLFFYKGHGTPGAFSDLFRMNLMRKERGIWADCDVYCVRPIDDLGEYIFSWERPGSINGAVLRIPSDAPLLDDLLSIFDLDNRPLLEPHLPLGRRLEVAARRLFGDPVTPSHMQYGATGPFALTHFVRRHGLIDEVLPRSVFYPVLYKDVPSLMAAGSSISDVILPDTHGVHIWRSQLTRRGRSEIALPEKGSALAKLIEEMELG